MMMMMMMIMMWRHQGLPANPLAMGTRLAQLRRAIRDLLSAAAGHTAPAGKAPNADFPPMRPFAPTCANGCCRPKSVTGRADG
jgi:hypothetical protein